MADRETDLRKAERHVCDSERRVERQKAILAKLEDDGHRREAAEVRKLLDVLEDSMRLAREHLAIERQIAGMKPEGRVHQAAACQRYP